MSALTKKDLRTPFNHKTSARMRARMEKLVVSQLTAADLTAGKVIDQANQRITDAYVVFATVAGSGESMTVDIKKNGTTVLSGVYTFDSTTTALVKTKISLMNLVTGTPVWGIGDVLTVVLDYTASATTMTGTSVTVETCDEAA